MSKPKNQHFIPKVYLKHFSELNDGKCIFVLDKANPHRKNIQRVDSGNKIFWERNYYSSQSFEDPYILERTFAQEFEDNYHNLINEISNNQIIVDERIKMDLLRWIIFGKLRSPVIREQFKEFYSKYINPTSEIDKLVKETHLLLFSDTEFLTRMLNELLPGFLAMKWEIISTSEEFPFLTGDSPGFTINIDFENLCELYPKPFSKKLGSKDVQFFPLAKTFALEISAFDIGTDLAINFMNYPIKKRVVDRDFVNLINFWTSITSVKLISSRREILEPFKI